MKPEEAIGIHVTAAYASIIKNQVQLKYPNFFFERGVILYDYDQELYVYIGYTEEELCILREVASSLLKN
jgi:hypothetical protein